MVNKILVEYNNNNVVIEIDKKIKLNLTLQEAYQLCNELEKILFDEKTYRELEEEVLGLELKIKRLEEQLSHYKELLDIYNYYHGW
ncbi:hypothetical protein [Paraclostridium dentum]|uniref:hypothetical protein n=1 Tax=Paraclostridium dentum TaxID=2662455 RepID=UPI0034638D1C